MSDVNRLLAEFHGRMVAKEATPIAWLDASLSTAAWIYWGATVDTKPPAEARAAFLELAAASFDAQAANGSASDA